MDIEDISYSNNSRNISGSVEVQWPYFANWYLRQTQDLTHEATYRADHGLVKIRVQDSRDGVQIQTKFVIPKRIYWQKLQHLMLN